MTSFKLLAWVAGLSLAGTAGAQCAYSAYVDFGPAMTNGQLDKKEKVYRSSGLRKNLRAVDASKNFRAVYTSYDQVKSGDFEIINMGPFDTEAVAYAELNSVIEERKQLGYQKKTNAHSMPAVIVKNVRPC